VKVLLRPTPSISDRELLYLKIPRLRPLLLKGTVSRRRVWNIMRIIMKGQTTVHDEQPVSMPLYPAQIQYGLARN
jgi:hypothetical protein